MKQKEHQMVLCETLLRGQSFSPSRRCLICCCWMFLFFQEEIRTIPHSWCTLIFIHSADTFSHYFIFVFAGTGPCENIASWHEYWRTKRNSSVDTVPYCSKRRVIFWLGSCSVPWGRRLCVWRLGLIGKRWPFPLEETLTYRHTRTNTHTCARRL